MGSVDRSVYRNGRFLLIGGVSLLAAAGMITVLIVVVTSPGQSFDHPDGFTGAGRAFAVAGCALAAAALGAYGVAGVRVALILDERHLVIRNPWRTTKVQWTSRPKFEIRNRQQTASISSPATATAPRVAGTMTYRYREIVCVTGGQRTWIAATSRMRSGDRVDTLLAQLRQRSGDRKLDSASPADLA